MGFEYVSGVRFPLASLCPSIEIQVKVVNCIIASTMAHRTHIGSECTLKDCQVDAGFRLPSKTDAHEEKLVQDSWDNEGEESDEETDDDDEENELSA